MRFEYRIALIYLIVGFLYIIFSDFFINSISNDSDTITEMQTYKGIGYVLVTSLLLFFLIRRHLRQLRSVEKELENHRDNLQELVQEKTAELDELVEELRATNVELHSKSEMVSQKNEALEEALQHLKTTQAQLFQKEKMASLGVLTAGVAHEINNPLNFILGGVTGLKSMEWEKADDKEKIQLYLEGIQSGVERISSIVSGLSQLTRKDELAEEDCDMVSIMENCLNIMNHQFIDRIRIIKEYGDGAVIIRGNAGQLHQAFLNILQNATQAIAGEGTITIAIGERDGSARVEISDTGSGIEEERIKRITDPFYTTRAPGEGIGIGLTIVNSIIHSHFGEISFQSEQNSGTTVKVVLPTK